MIKKSFFWIVMLFVMFIAGCNKEDAFRSNSTESESKAEQLLVLLNGAPSQKNLEKLKSLVGELSESDAQEFSRLQTTDNLSKMQERGDISSYSEENVEYLSQKLFEFYQELYKLTGQWNQFALTVEEIDTVAKDEDVQQILYEVESYTESLSSKVRVATTRI
jgi:hypothetical protein